MIESYWSSPRVPILFHKMRFYAPCILALFVVLPVSLAMTEDHKPPLHPNSPPKPRRTLTERDRNEFNRRWSSQAYKHLQIHAHDLSNGRESRLSPVWKRFVRDDMQSNRLRLQELHQMVNSIAPPNMPRSQHHHRQPHHARAVDNEDINRETGNNGLLKHLRQQLTNEIKRFRQDLDIRGRVEHHEKTAALKDEADEYFRSKEASEILNLLRNQKPKERPSQKRQRCTTSGIDAKQKVNTKQNLGRNTQFELFKYPIPKRRRTTMYVLSNS